MYWVIDEKQSQFEGYNGNFVIQFYKNQLESKHAKYSSTVFLMRNVWGEDKEENHREMFEKDKVFSIRDGKVDACLWEYCGR